MLAFSMLSKNKSFLWIAFLSLALILAFLSACHYPKCESNKDDCKGECSHQAITEQKKKDCMDECQEEYEDCTGRIDYCSYYY